jgi:hypothetical protein
MWLSNSKLNARVEFWKIVHGVGSCTEWGGTVVVRARPPFIAPYLEAFHHFEGASHIQRHGFITKDLLTQIHSLDCSSLEV